MLQDKLRGQEGASLVIVLIVMSVFGLIISGLLTEGSAGVQFTEVVSTRQAKVYAADAGVSLGIQQVRHNNALCSAPGETGAISITAPATADVPPVTVTCTGTTGSAGGAGGHAIMVRNTTTGLPGYLRTQSGSGGDKVVQGPVFVEGNMDLQANLQVIKGNLIWNPGGPTCSWDAKIVDAPADSGYDKYCNFPVPPLPAHDRPASVPAGDLALSTPATSIVSGTTCAVFSPGHYIAKPDLQSGYNYFTSGFYYFDFDDDPATPDDEAEMRVSPGQKVWAGKIASTEVPNIEAPPACAKDPGETPANPTPKGTGAVFAFGKTARLVVAGGGASDGQMEIFARKDPLGLDGTPGLSIVAVPSEWSPTLANKSVIGTQLIDIATGGKLVVHGLAYARDQKIRLWATTGMAASLIGGVVANDLDLQKSAAPGAGMVVSVVGDNPVPRYVKIKATVPGDPGDKAVESVAVIRLENDINVVPTVMSWRTGGIVDPLVP